MSMRMGHIPSIRRTVHVYIQNELRHRRDEMLRFSLYLIHLSTGKVHYVGQFADDVAGFVDDFRAQDILNKKSAFRQLRVCPVDENDLAF